MGHLAPLVERQARCASAHTPPLGARIQTTRAPKNGAQVKPPCTQATISFQVSLPGVYEAIANARVLTLKAS
eukprot:2285595-Pyramimonas_sp.AAC.1